MHLLGSEALGDATNNVAEYTAIRNALQAAADAARAADLLGVAGHGMSIVAALRERTRPHHRTTLSLV